MERRILLSARSCVVQPLGEDLCFPCRQSRRKKERWKRGKAPRDTRKSSHWQTRVNTNKKSVVIPEKFEGLFLVWFGESCAWRLFDAYLVHRFAKQNANVDKALRKGAVWAAVELSNTALCVLSVVLTALCV